MSRMAFSSILAACSLLAVAPASQAQINALEVPPGSRVRVKTAAVPDVWQTGTLTAWRQDSLDLGIDGGWNRTIPLPDLVALEISRGSKSNAGKGALIGGIAGAAIGVASSIAIAIADPPEGAGVGEYAVYSLVVTAAGAGIGGIVGSLARSERWEDVERPEPGRAVAPVAGRTPARAVPPLRDPPIARSGRSGPPRID